MKFPTKQKYFDEIKAGKKNIEVRDAHITFICEETGETLRREINSVEIELSHKYKEKYPDVIEDDWVIVFGLEPEEDI